MISEGYEAQHGICVYPSALSKHLIPWPLLDGIWWSDLYSLG